MIKGIGVIPAWFVRLGLTTSSLILLQSGRHNCLSTCLWEKRPSARGTFVWILRRRIHSIGWKLWEIAFQSALGKVIWPGAKFEQLKTASRLIFERRSPFNLPWETSPDQEQSLRSSRVLIQPCPTGPFNTTCPTGPSSWKLGFNLPLKEESYWSICQEEPLFGS